MRWVTFIVLALALLLVACSSSPATDEEDIRDTVDGFFQAIGADLNDAYAFLTDECRQQVSLEEFSSGIEDFGVFLSVSEVEVRGVEIVERTGDTAIVDLEIYLIADDEEFSLSESGLARDTLTKQSGKWRLANCENYEAVPTPEDPIDDAVRIEGDPAPNLPGEFVDLQTIYGGTYGPAGPTTTAPHVVRNVSYLADGNSNPPAGGPHWGSSRCAETAAESPPYCGPVQWGIYRDPWEPETLVHNMEHGGAILWYNTADQSIIDELEERIAERLRSGDLIVMVPYFDMEAETIALTSWARIDKFSIDEYSLSRVDAYLDVHERRFNPEGF